MATYSAQITDLIGGTIDQDACDQWAADSVKEIISQLPSSLQEKASDKTTVTSASALDFDTATVGKILYCTRNNGSYDMPCRLISSVYAGLADDSTASNYYATADDPAYFIKDNKAEIKPDPDGNGASFYHTVYPSSIDVSADSTIANFPNEADYLVVLYAAIRQLLQYQSTMSTSFNSDIGTAFTATNTELDETQAICDLINTQADSAVTALGNMATEIALANAEVDLANPEVDLAKAEILETVTLIDGAIDTAATAVATAVGRVNTAVGLGNAEFDKATAEVALANAQVDLEDVELASGYMQTASGYNQTGGGYISEAQASLSEANGYVGEVNARIAQVNGQIAVANGYLATASGYNQTGQAYLGTAGAYGNQASGYLNAASGFASELAQKIAIANGYIAEAAARLGADSAKYTWYGDQYTKLQAQYTAGLAALKGS